MISKNTFGERLKFLIKKNNTTQANVAYDFALTKGMITKYCKGYNIPRNNLLIRICKYFNCTPEWLRDGLGSNEDHFDKSKVIVKKTSDNMTIRKMGSGYEIVFYVSHEKIKELFEELFQ